MLIEEKYPTLLYSDGLLFVPPENNEDITPKIREILDKDTETLIAEIIAYYRNGAKGEPIVPEALLESNSYNREIMELLRKIAGREDHRKASC